MRLKVVRNSTQESLSTEVDAQHANDGASLQIADMVENLVDFEGVPNGNLDRVRGAERIEVECLLHTFSLWQRQYWSWDGGYYLENFVRQTGTRRSTLLAH